MIKLLDEGADPNYVRRTDANDWYSGNTHTALYSAANKYCEEVPKDYVNVLEVLLKHGANPNFNALRGGWNHCTEYPLFNLFN